MITVPQGEPFVCAKRRDLLEKGNEHDGAVGH